MIERVEILAPAKVNPVLDILGRRDDGFHELDTVLVALDLCDRMVLERAVGQPGEIRLVCDGPFASADVPTDGRNLAVRAASEALALVDVSPCLELTLTKNIPSQAGLGGGSSDAAAAVLGVELLCAEELAGERRRELLARIGSDCVFFDVARMTGAARATGRGERLEVTTVPGGEHGPWHVALVTPEERCPTAEVYAALDSSLRVQGGGPRVRGLCEMRATEARVCLRNQLEVAALAVSPGLVPWRDALEAVDAGHFLLSGSGSSFFGLYDTASTAAEGLDRVLAIARRRGLGVRGSWVTRTSGRGVWPATDPSRGGA